MRLANSKDLYEFSEGELADLPYQAWSRPGVSERLTTATTVVDEPQLSPLPRVNLNPPMQSLPLTAYFFKDVWS